MRTALRLALILCLMLTGIGLGAARGTVRIDERMVLCTGEGIVVTYRSSDGQPDGQAHVCPDMALSLMAGVTPSEPPPGPLPAIRDAVPVWREAAVLIRHVPVAMARDPPA